MTLSPACSTMEMPLHQVAQMVVDCDGGEIPIVEREDRKRRER